MRCAWALACIALTLLAAYGAFLTEVGSAYVGQWLQPQQLRQHQQQQQQSGPQHAHPFSVVSKHRDCKYWSIGVGIAATPVSPVHEHMQVLSPAQVPSRDTQHTPWQLVADPFGVWWEEERRWVVFFETIVPPHALGAIAWATTEARDLRSQLQYGGLVRGLPAEAHASYPHVFRDELSPGAELYMLPQVANQPLTLYKAQTFPRDWRRSSVVASGIHYTDSSIVAWRGRWYVFAGRLGPLDMVVVPELFVSQAAAVTGPYNPHPMSPLHVAMPHLMGRNAGRIVHWPSFVQPPRDQAVQYSGVRWLQQRPTATVATTNGNGNNNSNNVTVEELVARQRARQASGALVRYTQFYQRRDDRYGEGVRAAVVTQLSPTAFEEAYHPDWVATMPADVDEAEAWNAGGAHHVDVLGPLPDGRWLVLFDGREGCDVTRGRPQYLKVTAESKARKRVERGTRAAAQPAANGSP